MKKMSIILALVLAFSFIMSSFAVAENSELEYVKLTYVNFGDKPTDGNADEIWGKINEILKREINTELEIIWLGGESRQRIALMYAANEPFDFAFTSSWFEYTSDARKNAFREITMDDIQTYMPRIASMMPEAKWDVVKVDGKIFAIPTTYRALLYEGSFLIRGDLREKYGMEPLTTPEDVLNYVKTVAATENDFYALAGESIPGVGETLVYRENHFQKLDDMNKLFFYTNDDEAKLYNLYFTEEYVEFAKLQRELYQAGAWAADAIADASAVLPQENFPAGVQVCMTQNAATIANVAKITAADHPEWKPELVGMHMDIPRVFNVGMGDATVINRLSENPERVMMAVDLMLGTAECQNLLKYGVEGVNYAINEEGKLVTTGYKPHNPGCNWNWSNQDLDIPSADNYPGYDELNDAQMNTAIYAPEGTFVFNTTGFETEVATVQAVVTEYERAIQFGMVEDIDSYIAEFREKLEAAGALKLTEEANRQLAEMLAK